MDFLSTKTLEGKLSVTFHFKGEIERNPEKVNRRERWDEGQKKRNRGREEDIFEGLCDERKNAHKGWRRRKQQHARTQRQTTCIRSLGSPAWAMSLCPRLGLADRGSLYWVVCLQSLDSKQPSSVRSQQPWTHSMYSYEKLRGFSTTHLPRAELDWSDIHDITCNT